MQRVIAYIDGFNLYFGLKEARWRKYYWLDVHRLCSQLLRPGQSLVHVKYFTSRVSASPSDPGKDRRQAAYLEALETIANTTEFFGQYLGKVVECRNCHSRWTSHEEKMTDVNIAVEMLTDASDDLFDVAMVLSADSDLVGPVAKIRQRFQTKKVVIAFPPKRTSDRLKQNAHAWFRIGETQFRKSQLPNPVIKASGFEINKPALWS
jgi:uncharacterized LabA/DUF88 family protein